MLHSVRDIPVPAISAFKKALRAAGFAGLIVLAAL
jgi:hypothetical protein